MARILVLLMLMLAIAGCARYHSPGKYNFTAHIPLGIDSLETTKKAIFKAGEARGWDMKEVGVNRIRATLTRNADIQMVLDISYTDVNYTFKFVSQKGLAQKNNNLKGRPVGWIYNLHHEIKRQLIIEQEFFTE